MKILVADDSEVLRRSIAAAIRAGGIDAEIHEVENGTDAIAALGGADFDCAFIDFKMPGKDGLEVVREVRAAGILTPLIIATAQGDEQVAVAMMKAGATDYLPKAHLTATQIQQSLRYAVRTTEAERSAAARLRHTEQFHGSVLNSMTAQIAVVDRGGRIVFVNRAWETIGNQEGQKGAAATIGASYLEECRRASDRGDAVAGRALSGLIEVLAGDCGHFSLEYPCQLPDGCKWFLMHAASLPGETGGAVVSHLDITERRDAELALQDSEARQRAILQTSLDCIIMIDGEGRVLEWNPAAERTFGYARDDAVGKIISDLIVPSAARGRHRERMAKLMAVGESSRLNMRLERMALRADGTEFPVELAVTRIPVEGPPLFNANFRDVTERKRDEQRLRASEVRFRRVFEANIIGMIFWSADGSIVDANDAFLKIVGYSRQDLSSGRLRWREMTPPEYHGLDEIALREIRATGVCAPWEKEYFRKDGGRVPVYLVAASLDDAARDSGLCLVLDLTHQRRLEEERRQSGHLLEAVTSTTTAAIVVLDRDSITRFWNSGAERMFGWSAQEVLGRPLPFVPGEFAGSSVQTISRVFAGATIEGWEVRRRHKDGTPIDVSVNIAPLRDREGNITGLAGIATNITERIRAKEQLLQSQRMESIGRLAGGVAHDFNNLLAIISGYSEGLLRRITPHDPLREHVEQIQIATERGSTLVQRLLAFTRGKEAKPQPLDLNDVVRSVHQMLSRVLSSRISLLIRAGENLLPIEGDPGQIEQILLNLALNARDAMPDGGNLSLETANVLPPDGPPHVPLAANRRYVRLTVSDTGHGMDEQTRARIFEPFFTTKERQGTGLGLWIVYGILQRCDGSISVRSRPGEGTTFDLFFPARESEPTTHFRKPL